MKIATFKSSDQRYVGVVNDSTQTVTPFELTEQEASNGIQFVIERQIVGQPVNMTERELPLTDVVLEAPLPRPLRNIYCVGKNYYDHAHEFSNSGFDSSAHQGAVPEHPIVFSKVPECVTGPGAAIEYDPAISSAIDYELELAVIIGKGGRGISAENALDHVWGYTVVNDVTARDLQGRHSQWLIGKSQDTFCPMGPFAVTRDELDLSDTSLRCWVNGELRQESNTKLLIFDVPTIISTISEGVTLIPGDVIATGTPAGVGIGFDPPKYLQNGDVVRLEIQGIGVLENVIHKR